MFAYMRYSIKYQTQKSEETRRNNHTKSLDIYRSVHLSTMQDGKKQGLSVFQTAFKYTFVLHTSMHLSHRILFICPIV
jgi:hypothetical protein